MKLGFEQYFRIPSCDGQELEGRAVGLAVQQNKRNSPAKRIDKQINLILRHTQGRQEA